MRNIVRFTAPRISRKAARRRRKVVPPFIRAGDLSSAFASAPHEVTGVDMTERYIDDSATWEKVSRRSLVAGATFFGAAMAAIGEVAKAEGAGSGNYSNAAIALPDAEGAAK